MFIETTALLSAHDLPDGETSSKKAHKFDAVNGMSTIFVIVQGIIALFFLFATDYTPEAFRVEE
jgi:uncharacterized membrane protein